MINLQPTLIGKILKLRPIRQVDFQQLYKAASDPLIWKVHPDPRRSQKEYFRDKFFKKAIQSGSTLVFQNNKLELVGSSRYLNYRPQTKDIQIGYTFVTRDYWGEKTNREIKHLMMSHIYQWVDTIYFNVGKDNGRSRRAVEKIGGRLLQEGEILAYGSNPVQSVVFEIKKADFKGLI